MQYEWGKRGCERPAYAPIVGSGFNSTVLHYSEDSGTMQSGDLVVIDAAGRVFPVCLGHHTHSARIR